MDDPITNRPVARRRLLRRAGTVAAGVAGAAVAGSAVASPAEAAPGNPVLIGQGNDSNAATTGLTSTGVDNPTLQVNNTGVATVSGRQQAGAALRLNPSGHYALGPIGSLGASTDGTLWSSVPGQGGAPVADFLRTGANSSIVLTFSPIRILDTRTSVGGSKDSMINGTDPNIRNQATGELRENAVLNVSLDSILVFGWSLLVNVTVVGGPSAGFLTLYPGGAQRPVASNVNYDPGKIASNFAFVSLGTFGTKGQAGFVQNGISVFARFPAQVILDVCGAVVNYTQDLKGAAAGSSTLSREAPERVRPADLIGPS